MSKKKYVIESAFENMGIQKIVQLGIDANGRIVHWTDLIENVEELNSDYINEHYGQLQDEAYQRGFEDGKHSDRIEVGDIVDVYGNLGVVTYMYELKACVMMVEDGSSGNWNLNELKKTGKHYDIASILEAMRTND